ncbi:hypothetical protein, partial [Methylicorpusculum sp.]|uniref:hypothetical protein n=1 Tax=Methylicorpusculum sp. TaxID=2713644 RepID=UPI002ABB334F
READDFVKLKDMGDGEVTSLMVGKLSGLQLDEVYAETKELVEKRQTAFRFYALSFAFATIAFFGLSSSIEISGISLNIEIVPHVAMALMAYASWAFSNANSKLGYFSSFFEHLYFSLSSNDKAKFLLRYPQALPTFSFSRTIRGFPKYVRPKRWPWWESVALFGLLAAVIVGAIIAIFISFYGFWIIWHSNFPSPLLAKVFVGLMVASGFFVWANPSFTTLGRRYRHYGLSESIRNLPEDRRGEYHKLISALRLDREARDGSDKV